MSVLLSDEIVEELKSLLCRIEQESGVPCLMTIERFGIDPIVIGEFQSVEVYDMKPGYEELAGLYDGYCHYDRGFNLQHAVERELRDRYWNEKFSEGVHHRDGEDVLYVGRCRLCSQYKANKIDRYRRKNTGLNSPHEEACQICGVDWTKCKWFAVSITKDGNIYDVEKSPFKQIKIDPSHLIGKARPSTKIAPVQIDHEVTN